MRALACCLLIAGPALADSPLTSIDFAAAYPDVPGVQAAREHNLESAHVFLASTADNGLKLAVASALGWEGDFATGFFEFLAKQKGVEAQALEARHLDASQLFAAGYLVATARYLDLKALQPKGRGVWRMTGLELLGAAAARLPEDFAVQYALALVRAQQVMSNPKKWCEVFRLPDAVVRAFPEGKRNLRPGALEAAQGYLQGYEESCPASAARKRRQELNQLYSVSKLGRHVVAGTQSGVVVWDPERPEPVAIRDGFICRGVTWRGAVWHGCEAEVVRWDGERFTGFLPASKTGGGVYYEVMLGPDDGLWVRRGKQTWAWDEARGRFSPVTPPWKSDVYDARFVFGSWFWVEFLSAIKTPQKTFTRGSVEYPGTDPRSFTVDATGGLWVADFESGLLRYDDGARRFVRVPGVSTKASGVAVDVARKRTWMLHYTDGLVLLNHGGATETIPLGELEFMRDLLLDDDTGDVWVAGWNQLVRLRADGPTWAKQRFVVR